MSNSSPIISLLNHSPSSSSSTAPSTSTTTTLTTSNTNTSNANTSTIDEDDNNHHLPHDSKIPPRKRSKVSRACDECRRKKIKCDASMQSSSSSSSNNNNSNSTQCTNCLKTNEFCTFTRIPLKRGPTKGYIRDFEGKVDMENRRNSSTISSTSSSNLNNNHTKKDSFSHHLPPLPISSSSALQQQQQQQQQQATQQQSQQQHLIQPIVLPPIDHSRSRTNSNLPLSPRSSVPNLALDHRHHHHHQQQHLHQPPPPPPQQQQQHSTATGQGHFWKVPYEYSSFNNERRGSADSLSSSISDSFSQFLNNKKQRVNSNSVVSDSDDEVFQRKTSSRSPTTSSPQPSIHSIQLPTAKAIPLSQQEHEAKQLTQQQQQQPKATTRSPDSLSVSSLSSLNHKLNFGLNFENQHLKSPIDLKNVETNIALYYKNYHSNAFILPLNSTKFINSIINLNLSTEVEIFIVDLFNSSLLLLNNNNKNSQAFTDDIRLVFQQIVKTYPIFNKEISSVEFLKLLFLSTLIILNYCVVLSGQDYSVALSVTIAIFNDFKINKLSAELAKNIGGLDYDDLIVIYSRLYFNLKTFDTVHSIGYKKLSLLPTVYQDVAIDKLLPLENAQIVKFQDLIINRIDNDLGLISQLTKIIKICDDKNEFNNDSDGHYIIISSWREFVQLYDIITKIKLNYSDVDNNSNKQDDEEEEEYVFDNFLKITRIVKKLINQMTIVFDNHYDDLVSNLTFYSSLIFTVFFKMLLSLKNLIISIIKFQKKIGNHDLMSRLKKLEIELNSIFYKIFKSLNFENLNILHNLNFINQRFNKNNQNYDLLSSSSSSSTNTTFVSKIDEWLRYVDLNFIKLVNDEEYGWLL